MSPNKRKKGKKLVAAWIDDKEFARIDALAKRLKIPRSELLLRFIERELGAGAAKPEQAKDTNEDQKQG
jgi:hypothetical protein